MKFSMMPRTIAPLGCQKTSPPPASSSMEKRPSSVPSLRWSRRRRLLEPRQVRVELGAVVPSGTVDPLEHRPVLVARASRPRPRWSA